MKNPNKAKYQEFILKELAAQYNVSVPTFRKYIIPIRYKLLKISPNKQRLRVFLPNMVELVYLLLGEPGDRKNSN